MIRPWQIFAVYLVSVAVAFAAMFALTRNALQLDRAEQMARLRAELEERVGGALWTMDAEMSPLLASELSRPSSDFHIQIPLFGGGKGKLPRVANPDSSEKPVSLGQERSEPAAEWRGIETGEELVMLRFQVDIDNIWQSPQCPQMATKRAAFPPSEASEILAEIKSAVDFKQLASTLPLPPDVRERLALRGEGQTGQWEQSMAAPQQYQPNMAGPQQQAAVYNTPNQRIMPQSSNANPNDSGPQFRNQVEFRNEFARQTLQRRRQEAVNTILNAKRAEEERWSNILWIGDHLVLARLATINGSASILGSCLDGAEIKAKLRERVRDTLPEFELTKIVGDEPLLKHRALATLPLRVSPPPVDLDRGAGWTPIQMTLGLAWLFLSMATISVGALLVGAIRLSERRASFVSAVTHELRSPLTTFQLYTEMLLGGMVASNDRETYLKTLKAESERLSHLVENVLQYSRLERGKRPKSDQTLPLSELMQRLAPRLDERLRQAGLTLQVDYADSAKAISIITDPGAVEQILFNLADNASKYACDGSVKRLDLTWSVAGERVICEVRDYGPGISSKGRKTLFQPFSKSVDEAAESAPGVGLGLALCRRLASQLGGSLQLMDSSAEFAGDGKIAIDIDPAASDATLGAVFRLDAGRLGGPLEKVISAENDPQNP